MACTIIPLQFCDKEKFAASFRPEYLLQLYIFRSYSMLSILNKSINRVISSQSSIWQNSGRFYYQVIQSIPIFQDNYCHVLQDEDSGTVLIVGLIEFEYL